MSFRDITSHRQLFSLGLTLHFLLFAAYLVTSGDLRCAAYADEDKPAIKPSPLDLIDPARMSEKDRSKTRSKEVVAVLPAMHYQSVHQIVLSDDGKWLVCTARDGACLWNLSTLAQEVVLWKNDKVKGDGQKDGETFCAAFSPDGKALAFSKPDRQVEIWDFANQKPQKWIEFEETMDIASMAFSPDGRWLAVGGKSQFENSPNPLGSVELWDPARDDQKNELPRGQVWGILPTRLRKPMQLNKLKVVEEKEAKGSASVKTLAFSPNGKLLAAGSSAGDLKLLDLSKPKPIERRVPQDWDGEVFSVAFSPDGKWLAVISERKHARRAKEGELLSDAATGALSDYTFELIRLLKLDGEGDKTELIFRGRWPPLAKKVFFALQGKMLVSDRGEVWTLGGGSPKPSKQLVWSTDWSGTTLARDGRHLVTADKDGNMYILRLGQSSSQGEK